MYRFSTYKEQYKQNLRLALPVVLTQLGQILTQFADNLMVGRYGGDDPLPLAAVSFGGAVFFILFITSIGIALGMTPLIGELYAQGNRERSSHLLQNGILFYGALGIAMTAFQYAIIPLMYHLGQPVEVVDAAIPYYKMLVWSMPFVMLFFAFKQFLEGVGNTKVEMAVTIIANLANVGFNWVFIYGRCGLPEMGAVGAGLGTLLSRIIAPVLMIGYFYARREYRDYLERFALRNYSWREVGQLTRMGLPIALQMFLESSAFVGTGIMMGWFGDGAKTAIGANQIATTIANCAFMIVMSIGAATTIRVSHCYGARNLGEMTMAAKASYHLVLAWNAFAAAVFLSLRHVIPTLFTTNAEVIGIASQLLAFAALYQLSDGIQNVSVGILRGIQDVRIIMPIALISYWLLNLPVGYLVGFTLGMGPAGLYIGFTFGLSTAALLMILRIRRSIRRLRLAAQEK
ncbi:MATE family efflux transporter [uncultured Alistipes sp.]|uniref:MATE family efflux transporter n=1 Tax=uncultured Alistipes sp. TaxID=538949 RepID=UPI002630B57C|nr:MATE family efflux transporter [uncultured Alistipes sp.]